MRALRFDGRFAGWRQAARQALAEGLAPHQVSWLDGVTATGLFETHDESPAPLPASPLRVPRELLEHLESAARYRCDDRWSLLYRVLWRVAHGDRAAMLAGDADGSELQRRIKGTRREAHHLHAFLRFHPCPAGAPDVEFVAWHEPAHDILESAAGHFADRMGQHRWLIATPDDGIHWDGAALHYARPCPEPWQRLAQAPDDGGQALWLAYYGSTFNPARLNRCVLETNMPVRFWKHLPEGPLIPALMSQARAGGQADGQSDALTGKRGKRIRG